jgi:hypothetical protein
MFKFKTLSNAVLCTLLIMSAKGQSTKNNLTAQLTEMTSWFGGEYDNFQQVHKEKEDKYQHVHENIHSIFAKVDLPAFGKDVFYVKQYLDNNPNKIYRQRLYSFSEDSKENAIKLEIYSFPTDSLYYDSHLKPEKLTGITPQKLTSTPGCEVFWKKTTDQEYTGYMKPRACNFLSKRSGKRIFITDSLRLTKNEIWIRDEAEDEEGKYVFGHKEKISHKLKKCNFYKGWLAIQREGGGENDYVSMRDVVLSDQGGKQVVLDKGQKTKYTIELSNVIYGKELVVLKLALYEDGKEKSIAYTWASPLSKNIGINMRWATAGFTLIDTK